MELWDYIINVMAGISVKYYGPSLKCVEIINLTLYSFKKIGGKIAYTGAIIYIYKNVSP